jgi:hypothetical protein
MIAWNAVARWPVAEIAVFWETWVIAETAAVALEQRLATIVPRIVALVAVIPIATTARLTLPARTIVRNAPCIRTVMI